MHPMHLTYEHDSTNERHNTNVMHICAPKGTCLPDMLIKMRCIYA